MRSLSSTHTSNYVTGPVMHESLRTYLLTVYREQGIKKFWHSTLRAELVAAREVSWALDEALRDFVEAGILALHVEYTCAYGHHLWAGPVQFEASERMCMECRRCDETKEDEYAGGHPFLRRPYYVLVRPELLTWSSGWSRALNQARAKETPRARKRDRARQAWAWVRGLLRGSHS